MPPSLKKVLTGPCPSSRHFNISIWISLICNPVPSQTPPFTLGSRAREFIYKLLKKSISGPCGSPEPLDVCPIGFQSQTLLESHLCGAGAKHWDTPHGVQTPHFLGGNSGSVRSLLVYVAVSRRIFLVRLCLYTSYPSACGLFIPYCGSCCSASF